MKLDVKKGSLTEFACDALIVNLFEGVKHPGGGTGAVDQALGGAVTDAIRETDFEGKLGEIAVIPTQGRVQAKNVVLVGLGRSGDLGIRAIMRASAAAIRKCQELRSGSAGSILHGAGIGGMSSFDCAKATVLGAALGAYRFTRFKTELKKPVTLDSFNIVELSADKLTDIRQGIERAALLADAITFARDLVNEPSNVLTPTYLANVAQDIARDAGLECTVLDRNGIEAKGFGLVAAVARGSREEPRFIELSYQPEGTKKTVCIIGKGVTFDTGGYSLKTSDSMDGMKDDMAGAAAVLGAMRAVGKAKPKVNVTALIPAVENSIGGAAIHPGDVFRSFSGRTVEVVNTDCEGRLLLADAAAYAADLGVNEIIDAATLTWGCVVALGLEISGLFGTDQSLVGRLLAAAESCGEQIWQLPLSSDYAKKLESSVADVKNMDGRAGAAITAAEFIRGFTKGVPWAHIDLSSASIDTDLDLVRKGASGDGTGTLIEYLLAV